MEESLKKDFILLFNNLKKCKNIFNYDELIGLLNVYEMIIKEQGLDIEVPKELEYEQMKFINKLNNFYQKDFKIFIKKFNDNYDFNKEFIDGIKSILDDYAMPINYYYYKEIMSEEKIIELSKEFYKYFDIDIYKYLIYMLSNNRIIFSNSVIDDANGHYVYGYQDILPYINVERTNTINDMLVLCHEVMHGYVDYILRFASSKEKNNMYYNNLFELYPKFIELVILDYLNMIGFSNRDLNVYKKDFDDSVLEGIQGFEYFINEDMDDIDNQRFFHNIEGYLYSEVLAIHYYLKYLDNKEEVKNNIYNLIIDNKYYEREYLLNNYDLSFNEIKDKKVITKILYKRI